MSFVVKIGTGYWASDDQEAVPEADKAIKFANREKAEEEAVTVRRTWDVRPEAVTVVELPRRNGGENRPAPIPVTRRPEVCTEGTRPYVVVAARGDDVHYVTVVLLSHGIRPETSEVIRSDDDDLDLQILELTNLLQLGMEPQEVQAILDERFVVIAL